MKRNEFLNHDCVEGLKITVVSLTHKVKELTLQKEQWQIERGNLQNERAVLLNERAIERAKNESQI